MPMPTPLASTPAAPSGGSGGSTPSGSSGGSTGGNSTPTGGGNSISSGASTSTSTGSSRTGSSTPNTPPANTAKKVETPQRASTLADRLRVAAEGEGATSAEARKVIKHLLEDGREVDVDITDHVASELSALRKRKLKVNDKEVEVDLDEAFQAYPLAEGARQKFEQAAELRKREQVLQSQVTELGKKMRDPKALAGILADPKMLGREGLLKFAESLVMEELQFEKMTPKERANYDKQQEIEAAARKREEALTSREAAAKKFEAEQNKAESAKHAAYYAENIPKFLDVAGLPNTVETRNAFIRIKSEALKLGIPHSNETVAREVAHEYFGGLKSVASKLSPEKLQELLGENAGKINQAAIDSVNAPGRKISVKSKAPVDSEGVPDHIKTPDQYRQWKYDQKTKRKAK